MDESPSSKRNWNEFDWEKEFRKDDERVNTYMGELPKYIDLPDEDAVIMKRIQRHQELVPHGGVWPMMPFPGSAFGDEDDPDDDFIIHGDELAKREGGDIYLICSRLARECCILLAESERREDRILLMRINCFLGKIMARLSDILDMSGNNGFSTLKVTICKRVGSDVNSLMGLVGEMSDQTQKQEFLRNQLQLVREKILALLEKARQTKDDPFNTEDDEDTSF